MSELEQFVLRLKCLHNLDGYVLEPVFGHDEQARFCRNPEHFLLACDDEHRAIIWRELEKRYARNVAILEQMGCTGSA